MEHVNFFFTREDDFSQKAQLLLKSFKLVEKRIRGAENDDICLVVQDSQHRVRIRISFLNKVH